MFTRAIVFYLVLIIVLVFAFSMIVLSFSYATRIQECDSPVSLEHFYDY